jgi:hypothetical protein
VRQRAHRHARLVGLARVLHHGQAAAVLDRLQAGGAVVEGAGQHHADRTRAVFERGAAEQRVDRRPAVVFLGPAAQADRARLEQHVAVGRGEVDRAGARHVAVARLHHPQRPAPFEQCGHPARVAADVQHHQHRRRKVGRQRRQEAQQGPHTPERGTDDDDEWRIHARP